MIHETKLAEMLTTRLCHDLTGPIGAVNNGAEFLAEEGFDMQNQAVALIVSSAHEAVNRLQFYRQAYGRVGDVGEASLSEKKKLVSDFFSASKIVVDWPDAHTDSAGVPVSQKLSRLMLNLIIIASTCTIRGGVLTVRLHKTANDEKHIEIAITGNSMKVDADMVAILTAANPTVALTPKSSQLYLTRLLSQELEASIRIEHSECSLAFTVKQAHAVLANAS